jgi:hypothetical protein
MKYRTASEKVLWIDGVWFDQGRRWLRLEVEEVVFNVEVAEAIRQPG